MSIQTRLADKKLGPKDTMMSALQGGLDQVIFAIGLIYSVKCAFSSSQNLVEDMKLLKPTFLTTVPYVLVNFFNEI
jgi:long-subunit acyl-CoA synthetase (AMP-forming)